MARINVYTCEKCGGETVTVDVDEGTTPYMLGCRANGKERPAPGACTGMAQSSFYQPRPGRAPPAWEWYRMTDEEAATLDRKWPGFLVHHKAGGLNIRARAPAAAKDAEESDRD